MHRQTDTDERTDEALPPVTRTFIDVFTSYITIYSKISPTDVSVPTGV